jgi:hypothetical protein
LSYAEPGQPFTTQPDLAGSISKHGFPALSGLFGAEGIVQSPVVFGIEQDSQTEFQLVAADDLAKIQPGIVERGDGNGVVVSLAKAGQMQGQALGQFPGFTDQVTARRVLSSSHLCGYGRYRPNTQPDT